MRQNRELLAGYVEQGSEEAFAELVRRYIDLVHSTAIRCVGGDRDLAKDVTQTVFMHLSRNAHRLAPEVTLGGWLHRETCHVASNLLRGERRRRAREQQVAIMEAVPDHTQTNLAAVAPVLDEAINLLPEEDRAAVLLRFFERLDFRAVGATLGTSEDAARMRVSRALEKLHGLLTRRGVTLSTAGLATLLGAEAVTGAPVGLAVSVAAAALTGTAQVGGVMATTVKIMAMTKTKAVIFGVVLMSGAAVPIWLQHQNQTQAREENQALRQQLQQLSADNERLSNQVVQLSASTAVTPEQERELMRLRSEVGNLRRQVAEAAKAQPKASSPAVTTQTTPTPEEEMKQAGIARLTYTRGWLMALMLYADKNGDQLPSNLEQAAPFMPEEAKAVALAANDKYGLTPDQFEIVYQGSFKSLEHPATTIVMREKQALQISDGSWNRSYGFADGHSEIHRANDGNFAPWEAQHMAGPAPGQ